MMNIRSKVFRKIKGSKKYRNLFIKGQIKTGIPFQVRALRASRNNMTQKELGEKAKLPQTVVSRIENGSGGSLSIKTLLRLAEAFDVALVVRFEPIDKLMDWVENLSPEVMSPESSERILAEIEQKALQGAAVVNTTESTPATPLRLIRSPETTTAIQDRFAFDQPRLIVDNDQIGGTSLNRLTATPQATGASPLYRAATA